jgi:hypothetical protein
VDRQSLEDARGPGQAPLPDMREYANWILTGSFNLPHTKPMQRRDAASSPDSIVNLDTLSRPDPREPEQDR